MAGVKMGAVWDRTSDFVADNLSRILSIALIAFFIPFSIVGNLSPLLDQPDAALRWVLGLVMVAFGVISIWGALALTALVLNPRGEAGRIGLRRLGPALLVWIALFLLLVLLAAPIAWFMTIATVGSSSPSSVPVDISIHIGAGWALLLYGVALAAFTFWFTARVALINAVIVDQRVGLSAIAGSFRLTGGLTWRLIGVGILYIVVSNVAALAAQTVIGSVLALIMGDAGPFSLASILTSIAVAAVQTGFCVLAALFTANLYLARVPAHGAA